MRVIKTSRNAEPYYIPDNKHLQRNRARYLEVSVTNNITYSPPHRLTSKKLSFRARVNSNLKVYHVNTGTYLNKWLRSVDLVNSIALLTDHLPQPIHKPYLY